MEGIKKFIKDRQEYWTTMEKWWTRDFIEDLELLLIMLEKTNTKKEKAQ